LRKNRVEYSVRRKLGGGNLLTPGTMAVSTHTGPILRDTGAVRATRMPTAAQTEITGVAQPKRVRAWYGLPGEIVIEGDDWHLVKVGPLPLPHPPLINRFIRRGLPPETRLRLSYWHELGHLQTLPIALAHALWLWRRRPRPKQKSLLSRLAWFTAALVTHEAAWELASETYVLAKTGREYRRLYQKHPPTRFSPPSGAA
jgi:hypothetical protein